MDSNEQPNPAQLLHNKAKAALALGEIYEANILIRKALDLDANDANIALAQQIKTVIGEKSLAKAQQLFEKSRYPEALEEAQKAIHWMQHAPEAENIVQQIEAIQNKKRRKGKTWVWVLALLFVGALGAMAVYYGKFSEERNAWSQTIQDGSISAYQAFIQKFPKGQFTDEARETIKELYQKDEDLWQSAIHPPDKSNLGRYLLAMENIGGTHIEDAKWLIDSLDFDIAVKENNPMALENYVKNHPQGTYVASARKLMATLVTEDDKQQIIAQLTAFYNDYANGNHRNLMQYFLEVTPRFMDKKMIDQTDLLALFTESQADVESEEIHIDTTNFAITKDTSGVFTCKFLVDSQRKVKKTIEVSKKRGRKTITKTETQWVQYYANQAVEARLNSELKIIHYTVRLIGSRKEILEDQ